MGEKIVSFALKTEQRSRAYDKSAKIRNLFKFVSKEIEDEMGRACRTNGGD
jgi:hypothetical protein